MSTAFAWNELIYAGERNGKSYAGKGYIKNISNHGVFFDADLYLTGLKDDFLVKFREDSNMDGIDLGTISIKEAEDQTWVEDNYLDLSAEPSGSITLNRANSYNLMWAVPDDDDSGYRLTIKGNNGRCLSQTWTVPSPYLGGGGGPIESEWEISLEENRYGVLTLISEAKFTKIEWKVEKIY